jgi:hypothetical protein
MIEPFTYFHIKAKEIPSLRIIVLTQDCEEQMDASDILPRYDPRILCSCRLSQLIGSRTVCL